MTKILTPLAALVFLGASFALSPARTGATTGTAGQRAAAVHDAFTPDQPAETTTTTVPAVTIEPTTTTTAPVTTVPTIIADAATGEADPVATATKPPSGHYACPAGMDATTQFDGPDCTADVTADPGPNNASPDADPAYPNGADGDQPGQTLGSTDAAYGADLTAKSCAIKPWLCGDGWTR
jgi:hypothetical protein